MVLAVYLDRVASFSLRDEGHEFADNPTGKTTLAARVSEAINTRHSHGPTAEHISLVVPMDGYHITRAQLSTMADPENAFARRGAAFTFDGPAFLALIRQLREALTSERKTLYAPSFDHAVKDPVENDISIPVTAKVLFFEGNYIALNKGTWKEAGELMDEIWFVEVDEKVAKERLIDRHVKAGIAKNREDAGRRAEGNDLLNGREIMEQRIKVTEVLHSLDDASWKVGK